MPLIVFISFLTVKLNPRSESLTEKKMTFPTAEEHRRFCFGPRYGMRVKEWSVQGSCTLPMGCTPRLVVILVRSYSTMSTRTSCSNYLFICLPRMASPSLSPRFFQLLHKRRIRLPVLRLRYARCRTLLPNSISWHRSFAETFAESLNIIVANLDFHSPSQVEEVSGNTFRLAG
jgi:hypothetical protein